MRCLRLVLFLGLLPGLLLVAACAVPGDNPAPKAGVRIIVRFAPAVVEPGARAFVADLSRSAGTALDYRRPLAGGTHLYQTRDGLDAGDLEQVLRGLQGRDDVVYAVPDRRMNPAGPSG